MPPEQSSDVKFEIGHVLFIDIVRYSELQAPAPKSAIDVAGSMQLSFYVFLIDP